MAVRHEVENLIRRGNIFYWRPRIPAAFVHCHPGSRLSLSLHCSDHRKAQIIGRNLNMRLAELKMNSKEAMTTKKQLQILFEHVRDEEIERLDDISTMAKRNGRGGDVVEMELDLEVGWACQLLAKFGTRSELSLEGDCPGLTYLLKNGVPASHVDAIRANYRGELSTARSPGFEDGIRRLIYHFEIEDTALNRERAMSKMFEGRAAALLDIDERHALVDRSLSEFTGGGRAKKSVVEEKPVEVEPAAASSLRLAKESKPAPTATDIPEAPEIAYLELSPRTAPTTEKGALGIQQPNQRIVAVADFEQECEKLIANMDEEWTAETGRDAMALVRMFKSVLVEHGVEHSGQVEQYHIGLLRQHFNDIPTDWGRSSRMRIMSAPELRAKGHELRKAAEASGAKAKVGLAAGTIRKHFGNLQHFLKHLKGHGFEIEDWTFEGLRPRKPKAGEIRRQQYKPTPQDIAPIFASPLYRGSRGHLRGQRREPGKHVFHDSLYYLPILFTYLGPRRKEFAGLTVNDIAKDEEGYVIILRTNSLRRLKTAQSERLLPMPGEMVRLGFIDYLQAIKKLGYEALFPDLFSDKTENDPGNRFYDTFIPVMRGALGEKMWNRSIHALRHGMADTLKQAGVSPEVIDDISGRLSEGSETNTRYTNPAGLPLMRSALKHYPIITSTIEPKPLQLLPWIENKQPPPWAREGKK
ncbi:integrase [Ensifer sp. LCM 4579]|nr:integrase [Ensifer sp. LCM 4579]